MNKTRLNLLMNNFLNFSKKQKLILTWWANNKYKNFYSIICDGSIRSGKTFCMSLSFVLWAFSNFNKQLFAICGKTIESIKRNVILQLIQHLSSLGFYCKNNISKNYIDIFLGKLCNRFYLFGGNDEKSASLIQGITLAGIFLDEVVLMPRSFVEQSLARCSFFNSKYFFNCNPKTPFHWFYTEWISKVKEKNALYVHMTMEDNPSLSQTVIKRYETLYTGSFYERFIKGIWTPVYGQIYSMFSIKKHVTNKIPKNFEQYVVSCDYGILNPSSFGLWGKHKNIWFRIKEFYYDSKKTGLRMTDEDLYLELKNLIGDIQIKAVIVDPSAASFIECIKKHNQFHAMKGSNNVLKGINIVTEALNNNLIKFSDKCQNSIREFFSYQWDDTKKYDSVKKENDHAMDDIRYFCCFVFNNKISNSFVALAVNRKV